MTGRPDNAGMIQCLECQRWFRSIGSHLIRIHGMTAREYRERWDLPASHKMAPDDIRSAQSVITKRMIADGTLKNDPIAASEAARHAGRGYRTAEDLARQAEIARNIPRKMIPDGGKRADGTDAVKARVAQRRRRAGSRLAPHTKLNEANIDEAKRLWFDLTVPRQQVAEMTGVALSTLYRRFGPRERA